MIVFGDSEILSNFRYLKVDAVFLANKHLLDFGEEGIETTLQTLQQNNIRVSGVNYGKKRRSDQVCGIKAGRCQNNLLAH